MNMRIVSPHSGFLVRIKHSIQLKERTVKHEGQNLGGIQLTKNAPSDIATLKLWDPLQAKYNKLFFFDLLPDADLEYYDYFDGSKLFYTKLFFDNKDLPKPLYVDFLKQTFSNRDELLKYPFRSNEFPTYMSDGSKLDILPEFKRIQGILRRYVELISQGENKIKVSLRKWIKMSENVAYLNGYYQQFSENPLSCFELDRHWKNEAERENDPEYKKWLLMPTRITVFDEWESYVIWELLGKIEDFSIGICSNCGIVLDIKNGEHRDRRLCNKKENIICYRNQQSKKKAGYRKNKLMSTPSVHSKEDSI